MFEKLSDQSYINSCSYPSCNSCIWFCFSFLLVIVVLLFWGGGQLSSNGAWNLDMRCFSFHCIHSQESSIRHAKIIPTPSLLKYWLGSAAATTASETQFSPQKDMRAGKVLLLRSYLLKNASKNSLCVRNVNCYESRCNMAKSINFQLGQAPQSSIILFSKWLFNWLFIQDGCLTHGASMYNVSGCRRN